MNSPENGQLVGLIHSWDNSGKQVVQKHWHEKIILMLGAHLPTDADETV